MPSARGAVGRRRVRAHADRRAVFMVAVLPARTLRRNSSGSWSRACVRGALAVGGGLAHGHARELLWLLAIG